jgi:hypothetical protein
MPKNTASQVRHPSQGAYVGVEAMTDKEMIASMKDRLALQRDVIGRLHYSRDELAKKNAELSQEIKWMKWGKT